MNETGCCEERPRLENRAECSVPQSTLEGVPDNCYDAEIKKVANGFVIKVGCKTFVAKNWQETSDGLSEYWKNPREAEKKYTEK